MRTSKFTPEQMVHILRQGDSGVPVVELCRLCVVTASRVRRCQRSAGRCRAAAAPHDSIPEAKDHGGETFHQAVPHHAHHREELGERRLPVEEGTAAFLQAQPAQLRLS